MAALVAAWLAVRPGGTTVDSGDALEWLYEYGISDPLTAALTDLLTRTWTEGWRLGEQSAWHVLGIDGELPDQLLQDVLSRFGSAWLNEIAATLTGRVAGLLAAGGDAAELESKIREFLSSSDHGARIVQTELTRSINAAASMVYQYAGVQMVRWVTEHDARVCPACAENEAAGPWPLGQPFPAGAIFPPQHPRCRCALMPA